MVGVNDKPPCARCHVTLKTVTLPFTAARLIVVGDIHGCLRQFDELLAVVAFDRATDMLVLAGDLVNKGPDTEGVVRRAMELGAHCVLGNHEVKLLTKWDELRRAQADGNASDASEEDKSAFAVLARSLSADCMAFIDQLPHAIRIPELQLVVLHAGVDVRTAEMEKQAVWDVTHMRKVLDDGTCVEKSKTGTQWAKLWKGPETIIFGHDAKAGLQQEEFALGLDTGCVKGRHLTAVVFPERRLVSVPGLTKVELDALHDDSD